MLKKITSLVVSAAVVLTLMTAFAVNAQAVSYDVNRLVALSEKFPNGKYWNHIGSSSNNPDGYTSTACTGHSRGSHACNEFNDAVQCMGYAYKLANEIVGTDARNWEKRRSLDISSLCVGDIIRYLNDGHSIVVVGVRGNTIAYTGANWGKNCLIKWGTLTASKLKGFSYVLHDKKNSYKNSDISFFENVKAKNKVNFVSNASKDTCETWKNTSGKKLNVYNLPIDDAFKIGSVKKKKSLSIVEKSFDGKTLWGKVESKSLNGWVKLNSFTFTSGHYEKPTVESFKNPTAGKSFKIKWKSVDGASEYTVRILKKGSSKVYKTFKTEKNSLKLKLYEAGKFYVYVIASNKKVGSWLLQSKKTAFTVKKNKNAKITEIDLPKNYEISKGGKATLKAAFSPSYSADSLLFSSSDSEVVKVNNKGVITALKTGIATITCKASKNPKAFAKCVVTVTENSARKLTQSAKGNSKSSVSLEWEPAENAAFYRVYEVDERGNYREIGDTKDNRFKVSGLESGKTYKFNVRACEYKGLKKVWTAFSGEATAETLYQKVKIFKVANKNKRILKESDDFIGVVPKEKTV